MEVILLLLALLGHGFLWAGFFNHTHAEPMPRRPLKALTAAGFACTVLVPMGFWAWFRGDWAAALNPTRWLPDAWLAGLYLAACWIAAAMAIVRWAKRRVFGRPPGLLRHNCSRLLDLGRPSGILDPTAGDSAAAEHDHPLVARLPGNQVLKLEVAERALDVPRLSAALDRLTILHLSDFHFTGRIGKGYFDQIVRLSNESEPDLVAITGDLVDRRQCIDWIPSTLGRLRGRYGAFFVLGNHDLRVDPDRIRQTLIDCGLVDLAGRWVQILVRGEPVVLAGNGLPWLAPAADLQDAPAPSPGGGPLRIALSHSPDQLGWARAHEVDLLLAGHTHGGQIRLPLVGPILSATHLGAAYSSGVFHAPPTIMHVTRGVSAQILVRIQCPCEMAKLVLRTGSSRSRAHAATG